MGLSLTITKARKCRMILPGGKEIHVQMLRMNGHGGGAPGVMLLIDAPDDVTILRDGVEDGRTPTHG